MTRSNVSLGLSRQVLSLLGRALIVILLIGSFFLIARGNFGDHVEPSNVAISVAYTFVPMVMSILLVGFRLSVLVGGQATIAQGLAANAVSQLIVLVLPSRLSELAKPAALNILSNVPLAEGLTVLIIERLFDMACLAILAFVAMGNLAGPYRGSFWWSASALSAGSIFGILFLSFLSAFPGLLSSICNRLGSKWLSEQVISVERALNRLSKGYLTAKCLTLSVLAWLAAYVVYLAFFYSLEGVRLGASEILVIFVAGTVGLILSVAPGGLGTFEAASALALMSFGVAAGDAISIAILLRICLSLPTLATAGWFIVTGKLSPREVLKRFREMRNPGAS